MKGCYVKFALIVLSCLTQIAAAQRPSNTSSELNKFVQDSNVRALAFSPDGRTFISGGNRLTLWDVATGRELRRFNKEASGVAFLPDGRQFISVHNNDMTLWDLDTATSLRNFEAEDRIFAIWISGDGQRLLSYAWRLAGGLLMSVKTPGAVQLWDIKTRKELAKIYERDVLTGALLPNGTAIYAKTKDETLSAVDLESRKPLVAFDSSGSIKAASYLSWSGDRNYMFFSPDGRRALTVQKTGLRFWDAESGKPLKEMATTKEFEVEPAEGGSNVAFSHDGRYIAWAAMDSKIVRLINVETATELRQFPHEKNVLAVAFSPDGRRLLTGGEDKVIRLWDISSFGPISSATPPSQPAAAPAGPVAPALPPPRLTYDVRVQGTTGNAVLRGGEEFKIRVQVKNSGAGPANGVRVRIAGDSAITSAITSQQTITSIEAGANATVEFAGMLPLEVEPRNAEIEVSLALGNAALPDIQVLSFGLARGEARRTRTVLSAVVDVDDVPIPAELPGRSSSVAVVIGLANYRESVIPKLPFAGRDAEVMAQYLENVAGVPKQNIKMLLDDRATRADFEEAIEEWLPRRVTENSSVTIYYAGHGALDPSTGEAYLVPYEGHPDSPATRLYSLKRLYEKLETLKARDVTVFLDSCFSGSGGRSVAVRGRPLIVSGPNLEVQSSKISVLAAAQGNQISSDLERSRHGLFTYFLLKGIRGEADTNMDGWVDLYELFTFTRANVQATAITELNREQVPVLSGGTDVQTRSRNLKIFARSNK